MSGSAELAAVVGIVGAAAVGLVLALVRAGRGRSCCSPGDAGRRTRGAGSRRSGGRGLSPR
ncbi:MAG TPA: hypothetical protein P5117_13485 [Spirochaetia bacterium]|nr:hypothetical protein [Spirochaetales bacterium]HRY81587.1 hypothetical protein [Spirochaetia bacterium]HRZ90488.1 hypothetical protein [Spirochaetia bacterium]